MSRRDELLAGVHTLNRRTIDEREASQAAEKVSRTFVEGKPDERKSGATGESGGSVQADPYNLPSTEAGLEYVLKAQIDGRSQTLCEVELEIADCEHRCQQLKVTAAKLKYDINIAQDMLAYNYEETEKDGDDRGSKKAKDPVPQAGPGLKDETGEDS